MIKTYIIQTVCCVVMLVAGLSCSSNDNANDPELIVGKEQLSFGKGESTQKFAIKTNVDWQVSSSEAWCILSPMSGSAGTHQIEVSVTANSDTDSRTSTITVNAGGIVEQVVIKQSATELLKLTQTEYGISADGGLVTVEYEVSFEPQITISDSWIRETTASRAVSTGTLSLEVEANGTMLERTGTIIFVVGELTETVTLIQAAQDVYIDADATDMHSDALVLAQKMGIGWNLGNSLEACSGVDSASETAWGNPAVSKGMIDAVKAAGFNTVRIPCAWSGYIEDQSTYRIKDSWLARVKEVVDYCVDNDMYAIINIHWDGGWLENNPFYDKQEEVNEKQEALWKQIAVYFRDYDEHLLFAGTNEVHADYGTPTSEYIEVQHSYNQTFVDVVRSTGGRNAYRNLIVQAYNTNITYAVDYLEMPDDPMTDRLMAEVHYYDPYEFCLDESSNKYLWGSQRYSGTNLVTWGNEDWADEAFGMMKTHFTDKGIPVVIGEYGAILRTSPSEAVEARNYYLNYVTRAMLRNGCVPVYWDNGGTGNYGFGLFNRDTYEEVHPDAIKAIMDN
ncbi:MAG: cellulase family glycosylhydrolase [Bacteroides sp.]|nr:cellulase family glycosylhydrolase [Bacteroides sp.]